MKFTVREVGLNSLTVDYEDGSWAEVPYTKDIQNKNDLLRLVDQYANKPHTLPKEFVSVGEELDSESFSAEEEEARIASESPIWEWQQMRAHAYPRRGDQLDALYWARTGDTTRLEEIDKAIEEVKTKIPKTMKSMSKKDFTEFMLTA